MKIRNLFDDSVSPASGENLEVLLEHRNLLVERIVSSDGEHSGTYVQSQDEWVLLVRGAAVLRIEEKVVELAAGDYLFIPRGVPHTVERTSNGALWLTVHLHPDSGRP